MKAQRGHPPLRGGKTVQQYSVGLGADDVAYLALLAGSRAAAVRMCIAFARVTQRDILPRFMKRCWANGRTLAEVLTQLMEGYVTMPTPDEVRAALERGPENE